MDRRIESTKLIFVNKWYVKFKNNIHLNNKHKLVKEIFLIFKEDVVF